MKDKVAYIAGFMDADGNIGLIRQKGVGYVARIGATNANLAPLLAIQDALGGKIYSRVPNNPAHSTTHHLTWTSRSEVSRVLGQLIPYLIGKQEVAVLVKEFVDSRLASSPTRGTNKPYTAREAELYSLVNELRSKYYKKPMRTI